MVAPVNHTCLDSEQIERYLLRHLSGAGIAIVEENLLACEHCQELFSEVEMFVDAFRRALSGSDQLKPLAIGEEGGHRINRNPS